MQRESICGLDRVDQYYISTTPRVVAAPLCHRTLSYEPQIFLLPGDQVAIMPAGQYTGGDIQSPAHDRPLIFRFRTPPSTAAGTNADPAPNVTLFLVVS
jgi:hypothetical protein